MNHHRAWEARDSAAVRDRGHRTVAEQEYEVHSFPRFSRIALARGTIDPLRIFAVSAYWKHSDFRIPAEVRNDRKTARISVENRNRSARVEAQLVP